MKKTRRKPPSSQAKGSIALLHSFGLKNAGATYQRLVNKMFNKQIGRNMEVYVDDMLFKSKEELAHLDDLKETLGASKSTR